MADLADALLRDTRANQPAASAVGSGTVFCVTDEGNILEQSDRIAWNAYSPIDASGLGLGTAATHDVGDFLQPSNDLSDVASASTARTNLGLGTAATQASGAFLQPSNNLSDVSSAATARTNLGVDAAIAAAVAGLSWKQAVRAATTATGTLASAFANSQTIDGVTLVTGDRILIKNQSSASENGIYIVAASGAPSRATDADSGAELVNATCYVSEGTTNADTQWTCTNNATPTLGSTSIAFAQLSTGSGETNTASNVGGGAQVFKAKTGVDLAFRSLLAGNNVTLTQNTNDVTIDVAGVSGGLDAVPGSPNVADDEFSTGSSIDTAGTRAAGATAWTARFSNVGITTAITNGELVATLPQTGSFLWEGFTQPLPGSGNCTYRAKLVWAGKPVNYHRLGLIIERGSGGSLKALVYYLFALSNAINMDRISTASDSYSATPATFGMGVNPAAPIYFELEYNSTNIIFRFLAAGMDRFLTLNTEAEATWLGGRADRIGIVVLSANAAQGNMIGYVPWFRRTA